MLKSEVDILSLQKFDSEMERADNTDNYICFKYDIVVTLLSLKHRFNLINRRWANNQELHIDIVDNRITLYN